METKLINLKQNITIKDYGDQVVINFFIDILISKELNYHLYFLKNNLESELLLKFKNYKLFLKASDESLNKVNAFSIKNKVIKFSFSINQLEYLINYVEKYSKNGLADSEHIDLDFEYINKEVTITIKSKMFLDFDEDEILKLID